MMKKLLKIVTALVLAVLLTAGCLLSAFAEGENSSEDLSAMEQNGSVENEKDIEIDDDDWGSIDPELIASCPVTVEQVVAEPTEVPATPVPEVKPTEVPATPVPEVKPTEVPATPVPEVKPTEVPATPVPEVKPTEVPATPVPEVKPTEAPVTPVPEVKPTEAPATPVPEVKPTEVPVTFVPEVKEETAVSSQPENKAENAETAEETVVPADEKDTKKEKLNKNQSEEEPAEETSVYYMITPKEYKEYFFGDTIVLAPRADGAYMSEALKWQRRARGVESAIWEDIGKFPSCELVITFETVAYEYRFVTDEGKTSEVFAIDATEKIEEENVLSEDAIDEAPVEEEKTPLNEEQISAEPDASEGKIDSADTAEQGTPAEQPEENEQAAETEQDTENDPEEENEQTAEAETDEVPVAAKEAATVEETEQNEEAAQIAETEQNEANEQIDESEQITETEQNETAEQIAEPEQNGETEQAAEPEQIEETEPNEEKTLIKAQTVRKARIYDENGEILLIIESGKEIQIIEIGDPQCYIQYKDYTGYMDNEDIVLIDGTEIEGTNLRRILLSSNIDQLEAVTEGTTVEIRVTLEGFEGLDYSVRWQYSPDGGKTAVDIPGARNLTYSYTITQDNFNYGYRVFIDVEDR